MVENKEILYDNKQPGSLLTCEDMNEIKLKHNLLLKEYEESKSGVNIIIDDINSKVAILEKNVSSNILNIELDSEGNLNAIYGGDSSAFKNGYIAENGDVILEFEYQ